MSQLIDHFLLNFSHFQGKRLPSLKLAQRSAAFEAIKKLYNCRELSENLLPINKQKCLENFKSIYFKSWEQFESGMHWYPWIDLKMNGI